VHVMRRSYEALVPDGTMLDLQVIPPDPRVETVDGRLLCEADGNPLFEYADAARDAVDLFIRERLLEEEAVDDHDVVQHYSTGAELVEDWEPKKRTLPVETLPFLRTFQRECVVRERCRLRLLRRLNLSAKTG
jgi:hypothetical protein